MRIAVAGGTGQAGTTRSPPPGSADTRSSCSARRASTSSPEPESRRHSQVSTPSSTRERERTSRPSVPRATTRSLLTAEARRAWATSWSSRSSGPTACRRRSMPGRSRRSATARAASRTRSPGPRSSTSSPSRSGEFAKLGPLHFAPDGAAAGRGAGSRRAPRRSRRGAPAGRAPDFAGPREESLADMVRGRAGRGRERGSP